MASTCTLRTLFTYALAGRPRSNAIDRELREKRVLRLGWRPHCYPLTLDFPNLYHECLGLQKVFLACPMGL